MIQFLLGYYIAFVLGSQIPLNCGMASQLKVDGCYFYDTDTIYVNKDSTQPEDFVLYHEIGHRTFGYDFDKALFPNEEVMADQFGLYIYTFKYPYLGPIPPQNRAFFESKCNQTCAQNILAIPIPNLKPWTQPFNIRRGNKVVSISPHTTNAPKRISRK